MSRLRTIKPDFWTSEQILSLSRDARLLFIGMWNFADDAGRIKLNPKTLKAQIFPADDDMTQETIRRLVSEIIRGRLLECYANDGEFFAVVTGWTKHQRIDKPQDPKHPDPNGKTSIRRTFQEWSANDPGSFATEREIGEIGEKGTREDARAQEPPANENTRRDPSRHFAALDEAIRSEYGRLNKQAQRVPRGQLLDACTRIDDPVTRKRYPNAPAAVAALARAAVAEAIKPNGKLGLALLQVEFAAGSPPNVFELRRAAGCDDYVPRDDE